MGGPCFKANIDNKEYQVQFYGKKIWPLGPNAMNNKFQPSSFYTRPSNDGNGVDNTLDEQDDQGQGDQGEHEQ